MQIPLAWKCGDRVFVRDPRGLTIELTEADALRLYETFGRLVLPAQRKEMRDAERAAGW